MKDDPDSQTRHRTRIARGVYRDRWGLSAKVQVGRRQREKRFVADTSLIEIRRWQSETRAALGQASGSVAKGTFEADVQKYLKTVRHLPTFAEREFQMALWVEVFGHRARHSIAAPEIEAELSRWLASGLAGSTVRHRRSALMHLWHSLDGKDAPNPVRRTKNPDTAKPEQRALEYHDVERILRDVATDDPLAAARLGVMAYTGMPPANIKRMQPEDINFKTGLLRLRPRRKGRGTDETIVPLTPHGKAALERFVALEAFGGFDWSHVYKRFQRACRTLKLTGLRPYDLRHSFGTLVYAETGDLRAAQLMLAHANPITTERYTKAAEARRLQVAADAVGKALRRIRVAVPRGSTKQNRERTA